SVKARCEEGERGTLPAPPPAPLRPKKNKVANEERALKLRKGEAQAEDKIALAKLKGKMLLKAEAALKTIPIDAEARERLETELTQDILEIKEEDEKNGQGGTTL